MSHLEPDDIAALERGQRMSRRFSAVAALCVLGAGAMLVVARPGRDPRLALALGGWFLVLGVAYLFWVWRGDWSPPDAERAARQQARVRMVSLVFGGFELLLLTLALLGLLSPEQFGTYWHDHRMLVMIACAGLLADVITRTCLLYTSPSPRD